MIELGADLAAIAGLAYVLHHGLTVRDPRAFARWRTRQILAELAATYCRFVVDVTAALLPTFRRLADEAVRTVRALDRWWADLEPDTRARLTAMARAEAAVRTPESYTDDPGGSPA